MFWGAFLALASISCDKEDPPVILDPDPEPTGYVQYGEPFTEVPATSDIVMYEVNLRAFSASGDLAGVRNGLDHLQDLGVNLIWLMPIHPIGAVNSVNSPYSVQNYLEVSAEYGTLDDLRLLTDEAHARGMAVMMDWVANHTAWDNPWIQNKSWYTQDATGEIIHPAGTNWMDVADLNFDNSDMREAMIDAMKYWVLEANVDGYRCDYADGVPYNFWKQAIDTLHDIPGRELILLAEGSRLDHYTAGFDMTYAWNWYSSLKSVFNGQTATALYNTHQIEYNGIPAGKHKLRYSTNHDESAWDQTPMTLFNGEKGATAASIATIFLGGVPLIYTAQEVGRTATVPFFSNTIINWNDHPDMLKAYQDALNFYNSSAVARRGTNTNYSNIDIVCFQKELDGEKLLVLVNVRGDQVDFPLPVDLQGSSWTDAFSGDPVSLTDTLSLAGYEYVLLKQ